MTKFVCPSCSRPIATRRHKKCTYCGVSLPEELLFTPEEKIFVEAENKNLHKELHKTIERRQDDNRKARKRKKQDFDYLLEEKFESRQTKSRNLIPKIVFVATFILYSAWGFYLGSLCLDGKADTSSVNMLLLKTGFPLSVIAIIGDGSQPTSISYSAPLIAGGALQWAFVFFIIAQFFINRKK